MYGVFVGMGLVGVVVLRLRKVMVGCSVLLLVMLRLLF